MIVCRFITFLLDNWAVLAGGRIVPASFTLPANRSRFLFLVEILIVTFLGPTHLDVGPLRHRNGADKIAVAIHQMITAENTLTSLAVIDERPDGSGILLLYERMLGRGRKFRTCSRSSMRSSSDGSSPVDTGLRIRLR